jgi:protein-disulfide isomerase
MENNRLTIPIAIIIAGVIIGGAFYFTRSGGSNSNDAGLPNVVNSTVRPVDSTDHILGDPNAPIKIVEYSDTECPFCKQFQSVMHQVMDTYGKTGQVAWVYRQFPLYKGSDALHPLAEKEAEATECVNELGGPEKFWTYLDDIYEVTPSNNGLDPAKLPELAVSIGIDRDAFENCLNSGKYADKISKSYDEALNAGANGTPYSIILTNDGRKIPVSGGQTYESMKAVIDTLLSAMGATPTTPTGSSTPATE